jgi:hypothetical protein
MHPADPDRVKATQITERQRRLWNALNDFIRKSGGGWLVSAPHERWLRAEVERGSSLPVKLYEMGYDVQAAGIGTRVTSSGFLPVDIITFKLPI